MNLTLKQLLKSVAVCACACALNASATGFFADSFEAPDGSDGLPISQYKMVVSGVQNETTNFVWLAAAGDASTIVSNDAAYAAITGNGPISNSLETTELVLNLETEGNTLSRTAGVSIASAPVYIDTLIKFTPSEDDPAIDMADVKVALYVNAQSNLVVVHTFYVDMVAVVTNSVIDSVGTINPEAWYRLSMQVENLLDSFPGTKIFLDGTAVSHTNAYNDALDATGGEWFINTDSASDINMISFQGTGMLDELVVSDTAPVFDDAPVAIMLTLVGIGDGAAVFSIGDTPVTEVESGTEVTIAATEDWYVISALTGPAAFTTDASGQLPADSIVVTLEATASCTVTADTAVVSSGTTGIGGGTYPLADVAQWAIANNLGEDDITSAMEDDYLLNVAPGTDAGIVIDAIVIDGTTVTITVSVTDTVVDLDNINGTLKLYSRASLTSGDWAEVGSAVPGNGDDSVDIDITGVANPTDFFKAVVE